MKKKSTGGITMTFLILLTGGTIFFVFETPFAESTIDYFSFFVGIFLIAEASYKILKSKDSVFPTHLTHLFRIILGTCVFTVHFFQFMGKIQ